jgi:surface antigen
MRVRNGMVLGKLCLLLVLNTAYAQSPAFETSNVIATLADRWFGNSLSKTDIHTHRTSVYHALNNLDNGELVSWHNDQANTAGQVKIAYTWPGGGGVCRRIYSYIRINSSYRSFQDTACLDNNRQTWTFIDKY